MIREVNKYVRRILCGKKLQLGCRGMKKGRRGGGRGVKKVEGQFEDEVLGKIGRIRKKKKTGREVRTFF